MCQSHVIEQVMNEPRMPAFRSILSSHEYGRTMPVLHTFPATMQCYLLICHNLISPSSSIGRPTAAAGTSVSHSVARCLASPVFLLHYWFLCHNGQVCHLPLSTIGGHVCGKQPQYCVKRCSRSRRRAMLPFAYISDIAVRNT